MTERPTRAPFPWAEPFFTVGVTGTNGKTSTTRLVAAALRGAGMPALSSTTIGREIAGTPIAWVDGLEGYYGAFRRAAEAGLRHGAVELTSFTLDRNAFARLWRFDLGVFTNLTPDHYTTHGSWERYLAAKAQLFVLLGPGCTAVLNAADPCSELLDAAIPADVLRAWFHVPSRGPALRSPDLAARTIEIDAGGTAIELEPSAAAEQLGGRIATRLVGEVFAENALAAALAALRAGADGRAAAQGLAACPPLPGRFEVLARDPIVAVDYAHTPDALARTCETARTLARGRVLLVFGAGGESTPEKREPMGEAVGSRVDVAVVTSDNPRREDPRAIATAVETGCRRGGRAEVTVELDRRAAIELAIGLARSGDVVVVAGKGHEIGQSIGTTTMPFSDAAEVRRIVGGSGA